MHGVINEAKTVAGPTLLFACHADTVPFGDPATWTHDPLSGAATDGRLVRRGASDMRGGLAAALAAVIGAAGEGIPCAILITADEEIGCLGARAAVSALSDLDIGAVVIPESSDNHVQLGHRGALWVRLTTRGTAAHGSTPHLGRSALLPLAAAVLDIDARLPRGNHPVLGGTSVNIGTMMAGTATNIVPDQAVATLDIRFPNSDEPATALDWITRTHPQIDATVEAQLPAIFTSPDNPWIRSLPAGRAEHPTCAYFTDAAILTQALPGVPIAVWVLGDPTQSHTGNESVQTDRITDAVALYHHMLMNWRPGRRRPGRVRRP
jgi:succinyl-diaminopimelate desuccinylase